MSAVELFGRRATNAAARVCVRIEPDPLGPVNNIVRLMRRDSDGTTASVRGAVCRVIPGASVKLTQGYLSRQVDELRGLQPWQREVTKRFVGEWGWCVEVGGRVVLCVLDSEIWPRPPVKPVPWRLRASRAVRTRLQGWGRSVGDRVASRFGYVHESETNW